MPTVAKIITDLLFNYDSSDIIAIAIWEERDITKITKAMGIKLTQTQIHNVLGKIKKDSSLDVRREVIRHHILEEVL